MLIAIRPAERRATEGVTRSSTQAGPIRKRTLQLAADNAKGEFSGKLIELASLPSKQSACLAVRLTVVLILSRFKITLGLLPSESKCNIMSAAECREFAS